MKVNLQPYSTQPKDGWKWRIFVDDKSAGYIFIAPDKTYPDSSRKWVTIHVNQANRGQGIGTEAYRLACEMSGLPEVYAHMRKSNISSRKAAEKAGFKVIEDEHISPQLALVWEKP